jgi:porin
VTNPGETGVSLKLPGAAAMLTAVLVLMRLGGAPAEAQTPVNVSPQTSGKVPAPGFDQPSIASTLPGLDGLKQSLLDRGVNFQLNFIGDAFGNPTGGVQQGATYQSVLEMAIDANLASIGLNGATFRINAYEINGLNLSAYNLFNLATISSIGARPEPRLYELRFEQQFSDWGSIRIGQLAVDNQFFVSDFAGQFVNNSFGWPAITAANLPSGGPAYPLTTPGVRLKFTPTEQLAILAGIYDGDPAGAGFTGLQEFKDPNGLNFRVKDPPLVMGEIQFKHDLDPASKGLAGTAKFGVWGHFGNFNDQHYSFDGKSLADPDSNGKALVQHGNSGVYAVVDQMLWRLPDSTDPFKGVGAFARISLNPSDRNLVEFYADGGLLFSGLTPDRPDDYFGLAATFMKMSSAARQRDLDQALFGGAPAPARDFELVAELTYSAQIIPGWTVQPDFQYVFHPGGDTIDPRNPQIGRIPDAAVFGLRTMIRY